MGDWCGYDPGACAGHTRQISKSTVQIPLIDDKEETGIQAEVCKVCSLECVLFPSHQTIDNIHFTIPGVFHHFLLYFWLLEVHWAPLTTATASYDQHAMGVISLLFCAEKERETFKHQHSHARLRKYSRDLVRCLIMRRRAYSKPRSRELLWPAQPKQPVKDPLSSAQSATHQIAKFKLAISREDTAGLPQVIKPPASGQPGGTSPKVCSLSTPYAGYRPRNALSECM